MSRSDTRLPLRPAVALAEKIRQVLAPACERIEIAGSIRRRRPTIGDIELLAIPHMIPDPAALFDHGYVSQLDGLLEALVAEGRLLPGDCDGERRKHYRVPARPDVGIDVYVARPDQWGVLLAVRTGPAEFSRKLVTQQSYGGLLSDGYRVHDWRIWAPLPRDADVSATLRASGQLWQPDEDGEIFRVVPTPEETHVFEVLSCGWIEPEDRQ